MNDRETMQEILDALRFSEVSDDELVCRAMNLAMDYLRETEPFKSVEIAAAGASLAAAESTISALKAEARAKFAEISQPYRDPLVILKELAATGADVNPSLRGWLTDYERRMNKAVDELNTARLGLTHVR